MAYIRAENRLSKMDVYVCCKEYAIASNAKGIKTAMGVDVGKNKFHVVIGYPKTEKTFKVLYVGIVGSLNDVHDLATKFNTSSVVIDSEPETWAVREFQKAKPYKVVLCDYQERLKAKERIDHVSGTITVRRTEVCDATHDIFITQRVELPRRCPQIEEFASQMTNLAKILEEDEFTGSRVFKYKKIDEDHYYHAFNYFILACKDYELMPEINLKPVIIKKEFHYDPFSYI